MLYIITRIKSSVRKTKILILYKQLLIEASNNKVIINKFERVWHVHTSLLLTENSLCGRKSIEPWFEILIYLFFDSFLKIKEQKKK